VITVWVPGAPKTKGSMMQQQRAREGRLVQSVQGSEQWATLITQAVWDAYSIVQRPPKVAWYCPTGPVAVRLTFWLPVQDVTAAGSGDNDKLERNVLDALTKAGAYGDDVQVVHLESRKYPARAHPGPGVLIELWPVPPEQHRDDWVLRLLGDALRRQGLRQ
jgi:hypothetical protein